MTPAERVDRILEEATGQDLDSWHKHTFLPSIRNFKKLSAKQDGILQVIELKLNLKKAEDRIDADYSGASS
jgi:hypothetical protein